MPPKSGSLFALHTDTLSFIGIDYFFSWRPNLPYSLGEAALSSQLNLECKPFCECCLK